MGFANTTDIPIAVYVNGSWAGTFAPDTTSESVRLEGDDGARWRIEFRMASGTVLGGWEVGAETATKRIVTPCGILEAWVGARGSGEPTPDRTAPTPRPGGCN
jgi:hypothetical protein